MKAITVIFPVFLLLAMLLLHAVGNFGFDGVAERLGVSQPVLFATTVAPIVAVLSLRNRFLRHLARDFMRQPPILGPVLGFIMIPMVLGAQFRLYQRRRKAVASHDRRVRAADRKYEPTGGAFIVGVDTFHPCTMLFEVGRRAVLCLCRARSKRCGGVVLNVCV